METITITGKIWKAGQKTLVLTIPQTTQTALELQEGDIVQATITTAKRLQEGKQRREARIKKMLENTNEEIASIPEIAQAQKPKVQLRK